MPIIKSARRIKLADGTSSYLYTWLPKTAPIGVVQIVHGMAEHAGRYARFAAALNGLGYAVYAQDLPGHGQTAESSAQLGIIDHPSPFTAMLAAVNQVRGYIERKHPALPLILFGHSMGSFIAQHFLVEHGQGLAGCILSGTTGDMGALRVVGVALNKAQIKLFGPKHKSALTEAMTFTAFNKTFAPTRTASDWLSRDPAEVDAYLASPYCGFRCSAGLWLSLLEAGGVLAKHTRLQRIPPGLPLLLIAGSTDPACHGAQGPNALAAAYRKAGLNPQVRIYPEARHELLNETNRKEVTSDVLAWLAALP